MYNLYITSQNVTLTDRLGRKVTDIAIYDETRLSDYLIGVTLKGSAKDCDKAKTALYRFLEFWDAGEREIGVNLADFSIAVYPTDYIDRTIDMIELGKRPANPIKEIEKAAGRLATAISYKSPNAAVLYEELQNTIKKYPTFQIKEQA